MGKSIENKPGYPNKVWIVFCIVIIIQLFFVVLLPFIANSEVYYIDFESGNDANSGTKDAPFKHHPWDIDVTDNAKTTSGSHTYYFKKGITYRGTLIAKDSGETNKPITLSIDPNWGKGEAYIFGSERIIGGWKKCSGTECPEIAKEVVDKTWYQDFNISYVPMMLYELQKDETIKLNIARSPNWEITNADNPREHWWEWTGQVYEVKLILDSVDDFEIGELVQGKGKWIDKEEDKLNITEGINTIIDKGTNFIVINISKPKKGEFEKNTKITNGKQTHSVLDVIPNETIKLQDKMHLTQPGSNYWKNGVMWSEPIPSSILLQADVIENYTSQRNEISCIASLRLLQMVDRQYCRYFIEGLPQLLDTENEWCYVNEGEHKGRIYIRLKGERDPNDSIIELAKYYSFLDVKNKSNITVQGLNLKFFNRMNIRDKFKARNPMHYNSVFRITGNSSNISILECNIEYSGQGVSFYPDPNVEEVQLLDNFKINHNKISNMEDNAINCNLTEGMWDLRRLKIVKCFPGHSRIKHIQVSNNKINNCASRNLDWNPNGAIGIRDAEMVEVSHNIVNYVYGQGIIVTPGFYWEGNGHLFYGNDYSLMRTFIFNNIVTNSMLASEDYGGIASWLGGPAYVYNNISGNAIGMKYADKKQFANKKDWYRTGCWGPAMYLDNGFKQYVFNNILWGNNNNENDFVYNAAAFNEAEGFMNIIFNNTMYNCAVGIHKGMQMHNRCYYLNNLFIDIGERYISQEPYENVEMTSLGYAGNVFNKHTNKNMFSQLPAGSDYKTLDEFKKFLEKQKVIASEVGEEVELEQVKDAKNHDFRLREKSICIDKAKKVFVPWGLYKVVGEWGFYKYPADINTNLDEHINWNKEWINIEKVREGCAPRYNLQGDDIKEEDFEEGVLENWVNGSFRFDGKEKYWKIDADKCKGLDMDINNFLIEIVLRIENKTTKCEIVNKIDNDKGYDMVLDEGRIKMVIKSGTNNCFRISEKVISDNKWHHIISEVDRNKKDGINIYIDGKLSNGSFAGEMIKDDISNTGEFTVGKGNEEIGYFKGSMDFLRVSRGTLKEAETNIEELYDWEFNGPFLKDFYGQKMEGKSRDIGAIEYIK